MPDEQIDVEKTANGSEKAGKRRSGRKPGRPKKDGGLKERILDEAELAFAKTGFAGTSTRDIAKQADVNQGLIRYYFESKEQLYKDVFGSTASMRRTCVIGFEPNPKHARRLSGV